MRQVKKPIVVKLIPFVQQISCEQLNGIKNKSKNLKSKWVFADKNWIFNYF